MHTVETQFGGRRLAFETGRLAQQADGAVVVTYGDAVILGTVVMSDRLREGIDYFPLSVDYEERSYSIGKIPGSVFRREGRPPLTGILASRLTDRPLRPLFPKGMRNEVQIILTVLSHDGTAETDVIGTIAASAALMISGIPFEGPVGAVRVGLDGMPDPGYTVVHDGARPCVKPMQSLALNLGVGIVRRNYFNSQIGSEWPVS